jgi:ATP-dependent DNA helicase RecG
VFIGQNPLDGTYRRYNEGDYRCSPNEVGRMLADQSEQPADSVIVEHFDLDDLDIKSLQQYRNRFASRSPAHPWLNKDDRGLLEKLGGWHQDRGTGQAGLTVAGLLMFGKEDAIRDPNAIPQYSVDYREHLSDDPDVRWTDRVWSDGTWAANLFQFFLRVYPRLVADLKIPFQYHPTNTTTTTPAPDAVQRRDETIVHEAIREAFVNAMIHADFRGQGGVAVERYRDRLVFSNPGSLLVSIDQMLQGGVSECRNKSLQTMFAMVGYGEKAGSGIDKIRQGWATQKWRCPIIQTQLQPDRVRLVLPMVSLLPEESLAKLHEALGEEFDQLDSEEVQALVTADVEGAVSNQRLQQFSWQHRTEITKTLQCLVSKGFLEKDGHGPWATYRLDGPLKPAAESGDAALTSSPHNGGNSPHNEASSPHEVANDTTLLTIAQPAREKQRLAPEQMEQIILDLCQGRYLTAHEIGALVHRNPKNLRDRYLTPLSESGQLLRKHPKANDPNQAYTKKPIEGKR